MRNLHIKNKTIEHIINFINQYYFNQYACLLSGSYVDGNYNEFSDIDVLVFTKDRNTVFNETLPYKGLKIQSIIIPVQNIQEILWVDYITCKGAFINMISKGTILSDDANFLKHLIQHAKKLESLGGRPLMENEIYMTRVKMTSLLFDIMGGNDINELLFSITTLSDLMTEFKLKVSGNWCGDGKYRMRHIKNLDYKFSLKLITSLKDIITKNNKTPFINLVKETLNKYGGLLPYYSKANSLSKVSSNYLVIEIENNSNNEVVKHTIKSLSNLVKNVASNININYYFFLSKPLGKNKIEQNVYMVIDSDSFFINDYLIDRLNFLVDDRKDLSKLIFPFQFDPRYRFSTDNIYKSVAPIFYKTSKLLLKDSKRMLNQTFQLEFSLILFKEIKTLWFKNNSSKFFLFIDYLINCWLVFSYDDGLSFKTSELLKNKELVLGKFESMYSAQKMNVINVYMNKKNIFSNIALELKIISKISNLNEIPLYKSYLIDSDLTKKDFREWGLYREVIFRLMSIVLIDNRYISYIPFIVKKIELNG